MERRDLEKKLQELTRELEKEKAEKKELETRLGQKKQILNWIATLKDRAKNWFKKNIEPAPIARIVTDVTQSPVVETKKAMEEVAYDDIATYRRKLAGYDRRQLEDIYLHINKEAHPERFKAVVEELRRHLASK